MWNQASTENQNKEKEGVKITTKIGRWVIKTPGRKKDYVKPHEQTIREMMTKMENRKKRCIK